jgi:hypothetical protein
MVAMPDTALATPFDSLAAMCKLVAVSRIDPAFDEKHWHAIRFSLANLRSFAADCDPLQVAFSDALKVDIQTGGNLIRVAFDQVRFSTDTIDWMDREITEMIRVLLPVVRDNDLPVALADCRWAIEGALEERRETPPLR